MKILKLLPAMFGLIMASTTATAVTFFYDPTTPYLSDSDIPAGFYAGGSPTFLDDLEDGTLDGGITGTGTHGVIGAIPGLFTNLIDSVGNGGDPTVGHSWFSLDPAEVTFFFPASVTAAGLVWTDGGSGGVVFEAFGPGMVSLGSIGPFDIADGSSSGTTAEDRFFGAKDPGGIIAIKISNNGKGIEVDHIQYGDGYAAPGSNVPPASSVPDSGTSFILLLGTLSLFTALRKRLA